MSIMNIAFYLWQSFIHYPGTRVKKEHTNVMLKPFQLEFNHKKSHLKNGEVKSVFEHWVDPHVLRQKWNNFSIVLGHRVECEMHVNFLWIKCKHIDKKIKKEEKNQTVSMISWFVFRVKCGKLIYFSLWVFSFAKNKLLSKGKGDLLT